MPADGPAMNLTHHFLIAMPGMQDESFAGSVVYLCEHSERGALGLVINKPSDIDLRRLFDKVDLPLGRSDRQRAPGAIGSTTSPGRVFKGMRMAGRMGNDRVTAQRMEVIRTDPARNLLLVKGAVPGATTALLIIKKSVERK